MHSCLVFVLICCLSLSVSLFGFCLCLNFSRLCLYLYHCLEMSQMCCLHILVLSCQAFGDVPHHTQMLVENWLQARPGTNQGLVLSSFSSSFVLSLSLSLFGFVSSLPWSLPYLSCVCPCLCLNLSCVCPCLCLTLSCVCPCLCFNFLCLLSFPLVLASFCLCCCRCHRIGPLFYLFCLPSFPLVFFFFLSLAFFSSCLVLSLPCFVYVVVFRLFSFPFLWFSSLACLCLSFVIA
jgi:hypothetical protein